MISVENETVLGFTQPSIDTNTECIITVNESSEITKLYITNCQVLTHCKNISYVQKVANE
jgi:hypothetical protein